MPKSITLFILSFVVLTACNNSMQSSKTEVPKQEIDASKVIKIDNYWATPRPSFGLNSITDSPNGTLSLVLCAESVYAPFGPLSDKSELPTSKLKNFNIQERADKEGAEKITFQILTFKTSRLILFFDKDPETSKHSYIFKGEVNDSEVNFVNDIRVGMDKSDFIKLFFDAFPAKLLSKYNTIIFESCVQDIKHRYSFKDNKLKSVNFESHSYWKVDY